ncbi:WSC domain protein [Penicillium longicatenatum]|nr:WSC domain protein [Penicillium longicatenatum]
MAALSFLLSTLAVVSATPTGLGSSLVPRALASSDGVCGAYNGTASCTNSGFGTCCSQFGYCGSDTAHCGTGCQADYGTCGVSTTLAWGHLGCYTDSTTARALNTSILVNGNTIETCQSTCSSAGFSYAGMEYGTQCFCGNAIMNNAQSGSAGCTIPCPANSAENCGGSNAINMFVTLPMWQSKGCYSDTTLTRTLAASFNVAGLTNEKCQATCKANGYVYSGTEYGSQCFCGNTIDNGGAPASGCGTACAGDSTEICGGSNALSLFYLYQ